MLELGGICDCVDGRRRLVLLGAELHALRLESNTHCYSPTAYNTSSVLGKADYVAACTHTQQLEARPAWSFGAVVTELLRGRPNLAGTNTHVSPRKRATSYPARLHLYSKLEAAAIGADVTQRCCRWARHWYHSSRSTSIASLEGLARRSLRPQKICFPR